MKNKKKNLLPLKKDTMRRYAMYKKNAKTKQMYR